MDFNKTVDLIIRDLEEAREIIDDLKNYPGVPVIQIEMAKSKCRNAAEVIALLKEKQTSPKTEVRRQKTEVKSLKSEAISPKKNYENSKPEITINEPVAASPKPQAPKPKPDVEERSDEIPRSGPVLSLTHFDNLHDSLNEKLGSLRDDNDVPDYLKSKPLANLSQAIGINDRFLFIRELFNGNSESYQSGNYKNRRSEEPVRCKSFNAELYRR